MSTPMLVSEEAPMVSDYVIDSVYSECPFQILTAIVICCFSVVFTIVDSLTIIVITIVVCWLV